MAWATGHANVAPVVSLQLSPSWSFGASGGGAAPPSSSGSTQHIGSGGIWNP